MLSLDNPAINWTKLLGIDSIKVSTTDQFYKIFKNALSEKNPFLIELEI